MAVLPHNARATKHVAEGAGEAGSDAAMWQDRIRCRKSLERAPMASSGALVLRMLIMLFKMQPYESW